MTLKEISKLAAISIIGVASFVMLGLSVFLIYNQPTTFAETSELLPILIKDLTYGWKVGFASIIAFLVPDSINRVRISFTQGQE